MSKEGYVYLRLSTLTLGVQTPIYLDKIDGKITDTNFHPSNTKTWCLSTPTLSVQTPLSRARLKLQMFVLSTPKLGKKQGFYGPT